MPYTLEELQAKIPENNFTEVKVTTEETALPERSTKVSKVTPKKTEKVLPKTKSLMDKSKEWLFVLLMGLLGISAIALVIRGIIFLFSL